MKRGSEQVNQNLPRDQKHSDDLESNVEQNHDNKCIQLSGDWAEECKASILCNMLVFRDFITETEEDSIMSEIGPYMKRMRYEYDHWDDVSMLIMSLSFRLWLSSLL